MWNHKPHWTKAKARSSKNLFLKSIPTSQTQDSCLRRPEGHNPQVDNLSEWHSVYASYISDYGNALYEGGRDEDTCVSSIGIICGTVLVWVIIWRVILIPVCNFLVLLT